MAWISRLHVRRARGWLLALVSLAVALAVARVSGCPSQSRRGSACEREVRTGDRRIGVETCLRSYRETGDAHELLWAAKAYEYLGDLEHADEIAHRLLSGPLWGDAHGTLSYIALRRNRFREAQVEAIIASAAHVMARDLRGLATDSVSLSQAARRSGDFTTALGAADTALRLAQQLGESHTEVVSYIARADALRRIGDVNGAAETLAMASERASEPCDQTWTRLRSAQYLNDAGREEVALRQYEAAARANTRCAARGVSLSIAINEAWLLRRRDPAAALARLDERTKAHDDSFETQLLRGYIAADHGSLDEAERYLAQAETFDPPQADWPWEVACAHGELFEQRGGLLDGVLAEYQYRRSTALVAALRAGAQARSAFLVSSHREPYDDLIALLARGGHWREALAVILDLDASDMLRATAEERVGHVRLASDGDAPGPAPVAIRPPDVDAVLSAWRSRDLVIVIAQSAKQIGAGSERVYRLRIRDGEVIGEDVGDANQARSLALELFEHPGDRTAARALGRMMIPPGPSDRALHVLAIGSLGKVPLAALRDDDGTLILHRRPLVRVLALRAARAESTGAGPSMVIADPRGNLVGAALEGAIVARALGATARVSGARTARPATRAELWAARDAALLHIAGHVVSLGGWRVLPLADGEVDPAEMLRHGLAPRLAVVASCGSAAATDEEGWGSIAAALLDAGTATVIATDRRVEDTTALAVMATFYAQPDWATDPARALARVQLAFEAAGIGAAGDAAVPPTWAAFSVLGRPPFLP
jgi:tetratricopeptide (TPR) repeat protein